MSSLPFALRVVIAIISISILIITAGIKLEEYLKKRYERIQREEVRGIKAFFKFLREHEGNFDDIDEDAIDDMIEARDEFHK